MNVIPVSHPPTAKKAHGKSKRPDQPMKMDFLMAVSANGYLFTIHTLHDSNEVFIVEINPILTKSPNMV
jgi:hypothetical protein